jgi:hypothetical protein
VEISVGFHGNLACQSQSAEREEKILRFITGIVLSFLQCALTSLKGPFSQNGIDRKWYGWISLS